MSPKERRMQDTYADHKNCSQSEMNLLIIE